MKIEKRYHDLAKEEWDEIMEEVRAEEESRSEDGKKIAAQNSALMLGKIFQKYDEYAQSRKLVPDPDRMQRFRELSADALYVAKFLGCNIIIEDGEGSLGKITLEAESFIMPHSADHHLNHILSSLFLWASDVFVSVDPSGLCKIELLYSLYKEIPTEA